MVHDLRALDLGRQQFLEMASPTRRVVTGPEFADSRPCQDALDAGPHAGRRLVPVVPNRLENLVNCRGVYLGDRQAVDCFCDCRKLELAAARFVECGEPLGRVL